LTTLNSFVFSPSLLQSVYNQSIFGLTMSNFSHQPEIVVPEFMEQPELNDDEDAVADAPNQLDDISEAPNQLANADPLVVPAAAPATDREMEKQHDLTAIERHLAHWQSRPMPFIGVNVPFHSGGDDLDFAAIMKRPIHSLETVHQLIDDELSLSLEEEMEEPINISFEGAHLNSLKRFSEIHATTRAFRGYDYTGNPCRYSRPDDWRFLFPFASDQFEPSILAKSFFHDRVNGATFLGPELNVADYPTQSAAIAESARKGYDSLKKYLVDFFLTKNLEIYGNKEAFDECKKQTCAEATFLFKDALQKCHPKAAKWENGRKISLICMDCCQKVKKQQYTYEKFLRYGHHVELIEMESVVVFNEEKSTVRAGPKVNQIYLADAKCPAPGKLGLARQDPGPPRLPSPSPNYNHPYLIPGTETVINRMLGQAVVSLMDRIRKPGYDGGMPFVPMKYNMLENNFNDKMFCAMPITTFGNSVVDMDLGLALRVSEQHWLFLFD
jgi:hypothetical protein